MRIFLPSRLYGGISRFLSKLDTDHWEDIEFASKVEGKTGKLCGHGVSSMINGTMDPEHENNPFS